MHAEDAGSNPAPSTYTEPCAAEIFQDDSGIKKEMQIRDYGVGHFKEAKGAVPVEETRAVVEGKKLILQKHAE